jgi:hypothetical protein
VFCTPPPPNIRASFNSNHFVNGNGSGFTTAGEITCCDSGMVLNKCETEFCDRQFEIIQVMSKAYCRVAETNVHTKLNIPFVTQNTGTPFEERNKYLCTHELLE